MDRERGGKDAEEGGEEASGILPGYGDGGPGRICRVAQWVGEDACDATSLSSHAYTEDVTAPAPAGFPADPPRVSRHSFMGGLLLNLLLPGAGFTLAEAWVWHLVWAVGILPVWGLTVALGISLGSLALLLPLLVTAGMLWHYTHVYRQQAARGFQPMLSLGVKVALCVGQFLLGFFVVGILGAVLIPNLLGARRSAQAAAEQSSSRHIVTQVMVQSVDGTLESGPCSAEVLAAAGEFRDQVRSCTVDASDPEAPTVTVSFPSGRTITLP